MSIFNAYFGFKENPFNQTPDTHFFFPSEKHKSALNALTYAVAYRKGFVLITGEIGCGKTTVGRLLLKKIEGKVKSAVITNTQLSPKGILTLFLEDLGVPYKDGSKDKLLLQLNAYLIERMRQNENVVFIIDEAQNLSFPCLEEIRMLSNLETEKEKLIQIILMGQPDLRQKLDSPRFEQLRQRVRVFYHLEPLNENETKEYIYHRLSKAHANGMDPKSLFDQAAIDVIYFYSHGIPRLINSICEHALLAAYVAEVKQINRGMIQESATELNIGGPKDYEQICQSA